MSLRTRAQIVERARLHVGHRETANNRSPLIDAWLRRCGVGTGLAWCAAFASWCVENRTERKLGTVVEVAQAGALNLGRTFPETRNPQPGDLMFFATNATGSGHVGIVLAGDNLHVLCAEGNSANSVRLVKRIRSEVRFSSVRLETLALPTITETAPLVAVSYEGTR